MTLTFSVNFISDIYSNSRSTQLSSNAPDNDLLVGKTCLEEMEMGVVGVGRKGGGALSRNS